MQVVKMRILQWQHLGKCWQNWCYSASRQMYSTRKRFVFIVDLMALCCQRHLCNTAVHSLKGQQIVVPRVFSVAHLTTFTHPINALSKPSSGPGRMSFGLSSLTTSTTSSAIVPPDDNLPLCSQRSHHEWSVKIVAQWLLSKAPNNQFDNLPQFT